MIIVPIDVRCNFCAYTFCCNKCRKEHERTEHEKELKLQIQEEYLRKICYICRGQQLPIKNNESLSNELLQHIELHHLPLKCDKCFTIFESIKDFDSIEKCCSNKVPIDKQTLAEMVKECAGDDVESENNGENPKNGKTKIDINGNEEALTPLSKINLRWRRKSKEFPMKVEEGSQEKSDENDKQLKRQTSTPMQTNFDSISSMQFSSINCVSTSIETDLSPAGYVPKPTSNASLSPKHVNKKSSPQLKSRQKMLMQNTPLRQVMTKSIQRAIATHGHYSKNVQLQQRRMTFDSSSSSNEPTMNLMKLQVEEHNQTNYQAHENENDDNSDVHPKTENINHMKYEEIRVILRRSGDGSESSIVTNYKSCYSDTGTPIISNTNVLKKTISFESPATIDKTPAFLAPRRGGGGGGSFDKSQDDVFYTPRAETPIRRMRSSPCVLDGNSMSSARSSTNLWSFVSSIVGSFVTGARKKEIQAPPNDKKWTLKLNKPPLMLKAATNYFSKQPEQSFESDESIIESDQSPSQKRPRQQNNNAIAVDENPINNITSPISKRRRIQGRKPIERMRNIEL